MERSYKAIASHKTPKVLGYHQPSTFTTVTADSSALCVMTDLRQVSAATITQEATLAEATKTMISRGVRLLLVVDVNDDVVGLITARDTLGDKPINLVRERSCKHSDLHVSDLMVQRENIDVLSMADVLHAKVGHIVSTLKSLGRQHALVVEKDATTHVTRIRGIFSATQIGRQLGVAVQTFEVANTFADIEKALLGQGL